MARSREETKRLLKQLAKVKSQAQVPVKPTHPPGPDLCNAIAALNKVIDEQKGKLFAINKLSGEQKGKIDRQRNYIHDLEKRNADLVTKTKASVSPKPTANNVDLKVTASEKTIKDQKGRLNRQRNHLALLEKLVAKLRREAAMRPVQEQPDMKVQAGEMKGRQGGKSETAGPIPRQGTSGAEPKARREAPPHLDWMPNQRPNLDAPVAGSATESAIFPSKSVDTRAPAGNDCLDIASLLDRIGSVFVKQEQGSEAVHQGQPSEFMRMGRGQGQEQLRAGGSCWTTSGEEELEEGEWGPDYSGEDGWGPVHADRAWATDEPGRDGWGTVVADESG